MTRYCLRNNTDKTVNAFGFVIPPGQASRELTETEIVMVWREAVEGVSLVPLLVESESAAEALVTEEQPTRSTRTASGASRRGRKTESE